jgi:hypothetical protein
VQSRKLQSGFVIPGTGTGTEGQQNGFGHLPIYGDQPITNLPETVPVQPVDQQEATDTPPQYPQQLPIPLPPYGKGYYEYGKGEGKGKGKGYDEGKGKGYEGKGKGYDYGKGKGKGAISKSKGKGKGFGSKSLKGSKGGGCFVRGPDGESFACDMQTS